MHNCIQLQKKLEAIRANHYLFLHSEIEERLSNIGLMFTQDETRGA